MLIIKFFSLSCLIDMQTLTLNVSHVIYSFCKGVIVLQNLLWQSLSSSELVAEHLMEFKTECVG